MTVKDLINYLQTLNPNMKLLSNSSEGDPELIQNGYNIPWYISKWQIYKNGEMEENINGIDYLTFYTP